MSVRLALDEHISPVVAERLHQSIPGSEVESLFTWKGGAYLATSDAQILTALHEDQRVLVTYDTQIPAELADFFESGRPFTGILFIDHKTISPDDIGGLIGSLHAFLDDHGNEDWFMRIGFLKRLSA